MEKQAVSRAYRGWLRGACLRVILVPALCIFRIMGLEIRQILPDGNGGVARRALLFQKTENLIQFKSSCPIPFSFALRKKQNRRTEISKTEEIKTEYVIKSSKSRVAEDKRRVFYSVSTRFFRSERARAEKN